MVNHEGQSIRGEKEEERIRTGIEEINAEDEEREHGLGFQRPNRFCPVCE